MKDENFDTRLPRLFVETDLAQDTTLPLPEDSAHYLKNVLRRPEGSKLRVFNGRHGEYLARFTALDRRNYVLNIENKTRDQPAAARELHLVFPLIKKDRQDFMIEKSVELGATHFHPVLTQQTAIRDLNEKRMAKQIQEAAEQCERLDIPRLSPLRKLDECLKSWPEELPLYAAIERADLVSFSKIKIPPSAGFLIGPEGGFSDEEKERLLNHKKITPVNLGKNILRAETAVICGLSFMNLASD